MCFSYIKRRPCRDVFFDNMAPRQGLITYMLCALRLLCTLDEVCY